MRETVQNIHLGKMTVLSAHGTNSRLDAFHKELERHASSMMLSVCQHTKHTDE